MSKGPEGWRECDKFWKLKEGQCGWGTVRERKNVEEKEVEREIKEGPGHQS